MYIKNLPLNIEEAQIREKFEKFGKITSVFIKTHKPDRQAIELKFAFVCFENPDSALEVITEFND